MPTESDEEGSPSMGYLLDRLETSTKTLTDIAAKTSEPLERDLAMEMRSVNLTLEGIIVVLRDHLACHNCKFDRHTHLFGEGKPVVLDE